ncbi:MAG: flagellar basal body P-ring formation protein FlgA [Acidobacteria bacterium]|nr:flagellar basal body P-ring formation protein FlgA [Acidobacteriota bacterium]
MILALLLFLMPTEILLDADTIRVSDVVTLSQSDPRGGVSLGYAPAPGLARRIARYEVVGKLQSAGFTPDGLEIPDSILVRRRAVGLDRDQVMQVVLDAFVRQYAGANIEIISIDVPAIQVGSGPVELTASLPPRFDASTAVFVRLEIRGTNFARNAFVRTNVRIETEQPVLKNPVAAHSPIRPEDIEFKPMPVRGAPGAIVERFEGLLAKRDLQPGQALTSDVLYMPVYVQKGDSVTVKATSGAITIAATMRAKASGKFGDTIQVEHLSGQGITTARIIGPRILEAVK